MKLLKLYAILKYVKFYTGILNKITECGKLLWIAGNL